MPRIAAVLASALLLLQACASLPDAEREIATTPTAQVQLASATGRVPGKRSETILERIERQAPDGSDGDGESDLLAKHLAFEQAVNDASPLVLGNRVTLLQNGPDTFEAMLAAIRAARDSVNLETYIFDDGEAGTKFAELLLERQAAGVQVNLVYDSVGSITATKEFFERMRAGGIRVLEFNPVNPLAGRKKGWKLNNRDHRRQLVVDGRVAFTGGVNISETYSSAPSGGSDDERPDAGWRDTHLRVEGPVVAEFQKLFMETWERQNGEALPPRDYFPKLSARTEAGAEMVRVIASTPEDPRSQIFLTLISAIMHAESRVWLTIAYFAPDPQMLDALVAAAGRGVDVRLVLPARTDAPPVWHLGRSYYDRLLKGGVRIFQRRGPVMHAKTAAIDGVWSTVGSTNLDWRSFLHNDELNAVVLGRGFGAQMESMFAADLAESDEIRLDEWRQRSLLLRTKERLARFMAYWL